MSLENVSDLDSFNRTLFNQIRRLGLPSPQEQQIDVKNLKDYYFDKNNLMVQKNFPQLEDFVNHIFHWTYGLEYVSRNGLHNFKKNGLTKKKFIGKVNLFNLIKYLDHHYSEKVNKYNGFNLETVVNIGSGKLALQAGFCNNYWDVCKNPAF